LALSGLLALSGCSGGFGGFGGFGGDGLFEPARFNRTGGRRLAFSITPATVSDVQACAIGYDLARAIHATVSLRQTVLVRPARASECETHALHYLRRAGFRVNDLKNGAGAPLTIALDRAGRDRAGPVISAVATIGADLRIARTYRPVTTGVMAAGPIAVQHLNPATYSRTPRGPGAVPERTP